MLPSPGQQRAKLVDFGFARDDAFEDMAQISERLDIVELCRLDQRGDNRPAFAPAIRTGEEMVLGAQLDRPDGALDGIRIDLDAPVFEEQTEPPRQHRSQQAKTTEPKKRSDDAGQTNPVENVELSILAP